MASTVYTDQRDAKAEALFATWTDWQQGHTKDGRSFFAIPGSELGLFHMADQKDCSCRDRQQRGTVCKHMRAVRIWFAEWKAGRVALKARPANTDGWDVVPEAEQIAAAAWKRDLASQPEPARRKSYDELYNDDLGAF